MGRRQWKITGFDSLSKIFECSFPVAYLSASEIVVLLQRLASTHLTKDEIILSSFRKNTIGYRPDLEIAPNLGGKRYGVNTSGNPYYIARVEEIA